MCFLGLYPSDDSGIRAGYRSYHDWLLPVKVVIGILIAGCIALFVGIVLLSISSSTAVAGSICAGIGGCCLLICLLLCLHAYCTWSVRDQETQTTETILPIETVEVEIPGYASIQKPSSLKRNGKPGTKKVTMSPDIYTSDNTIYNQPKPQQAVIQDMSNPGYPRVITYIPAEQRHNAPEPLYSKPSPQQVTTPELYRTYPANIEKHPAQSPQYLPEAPQFPAQLPPHARYNSLPPTHILNQTPPSAKYSSLQHDTSSKFPVEDNDFTTSTPIKGYQDGTLLSQPVQHYVPQTYSTTVQFTPWKQQANSPNQSNTYKVQTYDVSQTKYISDEDYDNTVESTPMMYKAHGGQQGQATWQQLPVKHEEIDIPEPQPLQYPSAKRPMTFEQQSSSKMSIYDNILAGLDEHNTEL